ncbi:putative peroxisomalenoylisomerase [Phaeomoniella chlamydospora]|uniref:Putative peroxisomalenoylisomerase n=1 Tax=Phaeomoniella chlamydospora TaxID=158046 RepID=A0A0G2DXX0_PHACM|nr:putative peroxisomalenoylisomerase [Phaeomoniella chlamydospora]
MPASLSAEETISLRLQPPLAFITLSNPSKLNALDSHCYYRLACLMQDVADNPAISVTILTGTGRFFSAGADVSSSIFSEYRPSFADPSIPASDRHAFRREVFRSFIANNLDITRAFYMHPKILIGALNGPAVGLSAALLGFCDFIYATPHTFLLTPFSSLGLVAEGGASIGFVNRMGIALANEALIMSRKITMDKLLSSGFVTKEFPADDKFLSNVVDEVKDKLGEHLNQESILKIKALIRERERAEMEAQGVKEVIAGLDRFAKGVPQEEMLKISSGEKKHKL